MNSATTESRPPLIVSDPANHRLIRSDHLGFLDTLKSAEFEHIHRRARDHLIGVHDVLARWGSSGDVCLAGLFHNIYGTESFKPQAVSLDQRHKVAAVIGASAEELAYCFCVSRRISFFSRQTDPARPCIWDEVHKQRIVVSPEQLSALIDIEAANLVEQYSREALAYPEILAQSVKMVEWMLSQAPSLSAAARRGLGGLLDQIARDQQAAAGAG